MSAGREVAIIVAMARDRGIGVANGLPWRLRKDLLRFKASTMGHTIIMGRKTWESLGRPLPGRHNIVISRDPDFAAPGASVVGSLEEAVQSAAPDGTAFVIGGAQIYALALPLAKRMLVTEVDALLPADVFFPPWERDKFEEVSREHHHADADNQYDFDFVEYRRITTA